MACPAPPRVEYADAHDLAQVHEPLRSRLWTAKVDASLLGIIFALRSGKRTDWQQYILRVGRCFKAWCSRSCKGNPTTALPGTSNHRNIAPFISAADVGPQSFINFLHRHAARYGVHFPVNGEDWHAEPTRAEPTGPIYPYGTYPGQKPPKIRRRWLGFGDGATDKSVANSYRRILLVKFYGEENEVTAWQLRLEAAARQWDAEDLHPGAIDGIHGPQCQAATNAFKRRVIGMQKAHHLPVWPNADSFVGDATNDMMHLLNP